MKAEADRRREEIEKLSKPAQKQETSEVKEEVLLELFRKPKRLPQRRPALPQRRLQRNNKLRQGTRPESQR
jgi:hypothetical protein